MLKPRLGLNQRILVQITMIYELRIYSCIPGRLPHLLKRFESATLGLWKKHGICQAGFWTTLIGESNNTLTYLLAWESMAEREAKWTAFLNDADWHKARSESEKDGAIVANVASSLLAPTVFSAVQ